jgi:hypothetical protein
MNLALFLSGDRIPQSLYCLSYLETLSFPLQYVFPFVFMYLGPTQGYQWVPETINLGVQRLGREADNSPPSSAEVRNAWSYTSTPLILLHGVVLS